MTNLIFFFIIRKRKQDYIMLKTIVFITLINFSFLNGGLLRLYDEASETRQGLFDVKKGMGKEDVLYIMGYPYQVEQCKSPCRTFEVWYYIYRKPDLTQTRIIRRNLIPLVFYKNRLLGWGVNFYKRLMARDLERSRDGYTNDRDEWPRENHGYVPQPAEPSDTLGPYRGGDGSQSPQTQTPTESGAATQQPTQTQPDERSPSGNFYMFTNPAPSTETEPENGQKTQTPAKPPSKVAPAENNGRSKTPQSQPQNGQETKPSSTQPADNRKKGTQEIDSINQQTETQSSEQPIEKEQSGDQYLFTDPANTFDN